MFEAIRVKGEKGFIDTSWEEAHFDQTFLGNVAMIDIGDQDNPRRPLVALVRYDPGAQVPVHHHGTDYVSIVVAGSIEVTRKRHERGSVRVVKQGTAYGPLVAGPEGCDVIDIFADRSGVMATFIDADDEWNSMVAETLAKVAQAMQAQ